MTKYKNIFRVESARLKEWDYSNPWWYYVTINTKEHVEYFGNVVHEEMILNELGIVAEQYWKATSNHFISAELDYYVIMPNHIHGIIIINPDVKPPDRAALQRPTLSQIINQFKGSVKRWANKNDYANFRWQSRFYDRIIRNERELYKIRKYILQNPLKWELEKNNCENIDL